MLQSCFTVFGCGLVSLISAQTEDPVTFQIQLETMPIEARVDVAETAARSIKWRFTNNDPEAKAVTYRVSSVNSSARALPATSSIVPDTEIETSLRYYCSEAKRFDASFLIQVGDAEHEFSWTVACVGQTLSVQPLHTVGSVGQQVEDELVWRFGTLNASPRSLEYAITSTDNRVRVLDDRIEAAPFSNIQSLLGFECVEPGMVSLPIQITVGTATIQADWHVECTVESIILESDSLPAEGWVDEKTMGSLVWQVDSTNAAGRQFTVSVESRDAAISVPNTGGPAGVLERITTNLELACSRAGKTAAEVVLRAGSAEQTVVWEVECIEDSIRLDALPEPSVASVGDSVMLELGWQFRLIGSGRSASYTITSTSSNLTISSRSGTANSRALLSTRLTYSCRSMGVENVVVRFGVGNERRDVPWRITCTEEQITVVSVPSQTIYRSVNDLVSVDIRWWATSRPLSRRELDFTVSSGHSNVSVDVPAGSTVAGTTLQSALTYRCATGGTQQVPVRLTAGNASEEVTLSFHCSAESIVIDSAPTEVEIPLGTSVTQSLKWRFESNSSSTRAFDYVVATSTSGTQIARSSGTSSADSVITTRIRYVCRNRRYETVRLTLKVGSAEEQLKWDIACVGEDLASFTANFYQGPLVAQVEFDFIGSEWRSKVIPQKTHLDSTLVVATNRETVVELESAHELAESIPISLQFDKASNPDSVKRIGTERAEGVFTNYLSRASYMVDRLNPEILGSMSISIDPSGLLPERVETNNEVTFDLTAIPSQPITPMTLNFVPIRTKQGVPDLSDVTGLIQPIYELMPVGSFNIEKLSEMDFRELEWSLDTARTMLDEVRERWITEASADRTDLYIGITLQPDDVTICGIADVGYNASVSALYVEACQDNAIAHEIGHNLSLKHAPACGAENEDPDMDFPYSNGSIGEERGWFVRQLYAAGIEGVEYQGVRIRYSDVMTYCPATFTTQFSYNKAYEHWESLHRTAASYPPNPLASEFGFVEGRSIALTGSIDRSGQWQIRSMNVVERSALRGLSRSSEFILRIQDVNSGTVVHTEAIERIEVGHDSQGPWAWVARIPLYRQSNLQLSIAASSGQVVLEHALPSASY